MEKSIYSHEYSLFLEQLKNAREEKGLTQTELAERLGQTQSFVSKVERGERRLDVVELRRILQNDWNLVLRICGGNGSSNRERLEQM